MQLNSRHETDAQTESAETLPRPRRARRIRQIVVLRSEEAAVVCNGRGSNHRDSHSSNYKPYNKQSAYSEKLIVDYKLGGL